MEGWGLILEKNNWENLTYTLEGKPLESGPYLVHWPDDTETKEYLMLVPYHTTVNDMGHVYKVSTKRAVFKINYHGVIIEMSAKNALVKKVD